MTPAEAQEERENIYHPDLPFVERIEACIQRYRARRRLGASDQIFNKYLFLGGIDSTPRMFSGHVDADFQDMSPEEKRAATAVDTVHVSGGGSRFYNDSERAGWDVDFAGVAAGFLSENLPTMTAWDYPQMGKAVGVLENFLTYVLQHDVCPEYDANVKEALAVCQRAKVELPQTHQALLFFPGEFNLALSELFCEDYYFFGEGEFQRPANFAPENVFKVALSTVGSQKQYEAVMEGLASKSVKVVSEEECSMEVVSVHRPSTESRNLVRSVALDQGGPFAPIGWIVAKPCLIEDGFDRGEHFELSEKEETFFLDDAILSRLEPGFKLQLCVCELNIGIRFIKQARLVLVEWHTFLPQNLMLHFKEPVPNDRPPQSAAAPEAEGGPAKAAKRVSAES
ncbi:argonaute siRNA chaperone complex subunit Arb1 [Colletotrichum graminicola]|uniref:Argonaute siRNA chaperone complex subunit Arb1 n=1 Tax=Colletotrichum graminicola (strain M1.001 / M2 / FGSC 10212) TaxID=645133 RepID=E3QMG6_COLGM|nr:argonaute siRNA chaperone complex subunit Arb1 [Colletotrichum graminicola M1.001]EFQ32054.1 argonaute siRNA chaperone complex subunit Arb1 [Colletotrichum graminicola M1.001]WDK17063.1 argonaute siRNA chaperone complex subunit Arb1 [Colletotrichum graminicola]